MGEMEIRLKWALGLKLWKTPVWSQPGLFFTGWTELLPVRTWSFWWQWTWVSGPALAAGVWRMLQLARGSRQHLATA